MSEFLIAVIGVVIISLLVEVFFPTKRLRGAVSLSISLAVVFVLVGGVKEAISDEEMVFPDITAYFNNEIVEDSTTVETQRQLKNYLIDLGYNIESVKLIRSSGDDTRFFSEVEVEVSGEVDEEKLKDDIEKIVDTKRENIWVQN